MARCGCDATQVYARVTPSLLIHSAKTIRPPPMAAFSLYRVKHIEERAEFIASRLSY